MSGAEEMLYNTLATSFNFVWLRFLNTIANDIHKRFCLNNTTISIYTMTNNNIRKECIPIYFYHYIIHVYEYSLPCVYPQHTRAYYIIILYCAFATASCENILFCLGLVQHDIMHLYALDRMYTICVNINIIYLYV